MDRYHFLKKLGEGGAGEVYLSEDTALGKLWAVKKIPHGKVLPEGIYVWKDLSHPMIVRLADLYEEGGNVFLVMDYVEGTDLARLRRNQGVSLAETVRIGIMLCEILEHLHGLDPPVIWRDLKPSNLILDKYGRLHAADMDTAVSLRPAVRGSPEAGGRTYGTRGYAPPAQLRGEISPACDIYAAGATLRYLMPRRPGRILPHRTGRSCGAGCLFTPGASRLIRIIEKAMETDPEKQFATAGEMRNALKELEASCDRKAAHGRKLRLVAALLSLILFSLVRGTAQAAQDMRYSKALSDGAYEEAVLLRPGEEENYIFLLEAYERAGCCAEGIRLTESLAALHMQDLSEIALTHINEKIGMLYLLGSELDPSFSPSAKAAEPYLTGAWETLAHASWSFSDAVDWKETAEALSEAETQMEEAAPVLQERQEHYLTRFKITYEAELSAAEGGT